MDNKRSQQIRCGGAQFVLWVPAAGEHSGSKGTDGLRTDLFLCQAVWCLQRSWKNRMGSGPAYNARSLQMAHFNAALMHAALFLKDDQQLCLPFIVPVRTASTCCCPRTPSSSDNSHRRHSAVPSSLMQSAGRPAC